MELFLFHKKMNRYAIFVINVQLQIEEDRNVSEKFKSKTSIHKINCEKEEIM